MNETRQYIGARYVPKFSDPITWNKNNSYEALTIVTYLNNSYTSKKNVPTGTEITNTEYWVVTGNYNAQVEEYRKETESVHNKVNSIYGNGNVYNVLDDSAYDANSIQTAINSTINKLSEGDAIYIPAGNYIATASINMHLPNHCTILCDGKITFTGSGNLINLSGDLCTITFNAIYKDTYDTSVFSNNNGVCFNATENTLNYCDIYVNEIRGFNCAFKFAYPKEKYAQYNRIKFNLLSFCEYGFYLNCAGGWVNSNTFLGGRCWCDYAVYTTGTTDRTYLNDNKFINFGLEGNKIGFYLTDSASFNSFTGFRCVEEPKEYYVWVGTNAKENIFESSCLFPIDKLYSLTENKIRGTIANTASGGWDYDYILTGDGGAGSVKYKHNAVPIKATTHKYTFDTIDANGDGTATVYDYDRPSGYSTCVAVIPTELQGNYSSQCAFYVTKILTDSGLRISVHNYTSNALTNISASVTLLWI